MKQTVLVISEEVMATREIRIRGKLTEAQEQEISYRIHGATHPDDIINLLREAGVEIMDYDSEGCFEDIKFELLDEYEEEEVEEGEVVS